MTRPLIEVSNLTKLYRIGSKAEASQTLLTSLASFARSPARNLRSYRALYRFDDELAKPEEARRKSNVLWALDDVSFDVREGDALAIVGGNGAGKSTLLKVLSRITSPTSGSVKLRGHVSSLLEVGTGFHQELTGRENIYLNGAILGMSRRAIDRNFDQIVDFSGVERFLDTPVKRYSSGMKVRLAFSVAAHLEAQVMILDEVLAVGDVGFQQKCLGKMREVAGSGRTVLFVSHNMPAVESLCRTGIMLKGGKIVASGTSREVVKAYADALTTVPDNVRLLDRKDRDGDGEIVATNVEFLDESGNAVEHLLTGKRYTFRVHYRCNTDREYRGCRVAFAVIGRTAKLFELSTNLVLKEDLRLKGTGYVDFGMDRLPLGDGAYPYYTAITANDDLKDYVNPAGEFEVVAADFYGTGRLYGPPNQKGRTVLVDFTCETRSTDGEQPLAAPTGKQRIGL